MDEEFNLSEKIENKEFGWKIKGSDEIHMGIGEYIETEDVKEFIRKLKAIKIKSTFSKDDVTSKEMGMAMALFDGWSRSFFVAVDKLAGEKLLI